MNSNEVKIKNQAKMKSLDEIVEGVVAEYKQDPRNKVFVGEDALLASATEETGSQVDTESLRDSIKAYQDGDVSDEQQVIYDGAVAVCGRLARQCFGNDPDTDVDYDVSWLENDDGSFSAEIRPS